VVGHLALSAVVEKMDYADGRLLLALSNGHLQWLDMQLSGGYAYVLLAGGQGSSLLQKWRLSDAVLQQQWPLPLSAKHFVLRESQLWLENDSQLAVLDIAVEHG
jgi:hypothetical protein